MVKVKNKLEKLMLNTRFVFYFLIIAATYCFIMVYAAFADFMYTDSNFLVGTLSVALAEDPPFDKPELIDSAGFSALIKTFRAVSEGSQSAYVRAKLIPFVEIYDEELDKYVGINIDENLVLINVECTDWIFSNGYYYYKYILEGGESSSEVTVNLLGLESVGSHSNIDVRVTVRVELESAQIYNDVWKQVFGIENFPEGVEG